MSLKSSPDRYGIVAVTVHWLAAGLIVALLFSGFRAAGLHDAAAKAMVLRIHFMAAVLVLSLTAFRIGWWLLWDDKPSPPPGSTRLQAFLAAAVHGLLYVVVLGMIASGVGMVGVSGAIAILTTDVTVLPDFWRYPPRIPHGLGASLMLGLLGLHVAAALYHHFVRRDGALGRMWLSR
ncbi:cytochrome b [Methyloraptor flagellatus]|uniref:Cytochrome b/b6 domain-containing protein n=1 Tax=Methyloraptor flagellatus TaxID=3162530 RepID=A0AAU7XGR6_9HYPH